MAGNGINVLLNILGNAQGAVGAINQLTGAVNNVTAKVAQVNAAANQMGAKIRSAFQVAGNTAKAASGVDVLNQRYQLAQKTVEQLQKKLQTLQTPMVDVAKVTKLQNALQETELRVNRLNNAIVQAQSPKVDTTKVKNLTEELRLAENKAWRLRGALWDATAKQKPPVQIQKLRDQLDAASLRADKLRQALAAAQAPQANTQRVAALQSQLQSAANKATELRQALAAAQVPKDNSAEILRTQKALLNATTQAEKLKAAMSGQAGAGFGSFVSGISSSVNKLNTALSKGLVDSFQKAARGIDVFRQQLMNINDVFRFVGQGVTNLGRSLMFFFTLPVAAFLAKALHAAIQYEDAMVRVAKTTGLEGTIYDTTTALGKLSDAMRNLARNSILSHVELAGIAESLGQLGVKGEAAIFNLTQVIEMFSVGVSMAADEAALGLGKIANAFGQNLSKSSDFVESLANTINLLENETAASAADIMTTLSEFAAFAQMLKISAADAVGFSAALVSVGLSASEAGTALKNMVVNLPRHADVVSQLLSGIYEGYDTAQDVINKMNSDTTQVLLDLIQAAHAGNNEVAKLLGLMEVADMRGGRGLAALANNPQLLRKALELARGEWGRNTSLIIEYNRAMQSTASQMKLLKNNINDAGITIGEALLPAINQFIQVLVPAIQHAAAAFKKLDRSTQLTFVAIAAGILLLGPALMFFGQLIHAVTLIGLAFGQLLRVVVWVVAAFGNLAVSVAAFGRIFLGWPALVVAGIAGILKILSKMGVDVAGFFKRLAGKAITWGENLAKNLASGLMSGAVRFIAKVISAIANMIARFFESHSPPKEGPLSTIDKWGIGLMNAFLKGFRNADFSILSEVGNIIEQILTRGVEDEAMPAALKKLAKAREKLAQLISKFNKTGVIDENLLDNITSGLGEMGDHVKELLRLWVKYNALQERLAQIEARRKGVVKSYQDEVSAIANSNMSLEEKIAAIQEAQRRRDDNLNGLSEEEESLKTQSELMEQQLEYQKQMIGALNDQADIFARIAEIMKQLAENKKGGGGGSGDLDFSGGFGTPDTSGIDNAIDEVEQKMNDVIERFGEGKLALQGFFDAWNGQKPRTWHGMTDEQYNSYYGMYELGTKAAGIRDRFNEAKDAVNGFISAVRGISAPENASESYTKGHDVGTDVANLNPFKGNEDGISGAQQFAESLKAIGTSIAEVLGPIAVFAAVLGTVTSVALLVGSIMGTVGGIVAAFSAAMAGGAGIFAAAWTTILNWFPALAALINPVIATITGVVGTLGAPFLAIAAIVALVAAAIAGNWFGIRDVIVNTVGQIWQAIGPQLTEAWNMLKQSIGPLLDALKPVGQALMWLIGIIRKVVGVVVGVVAGVLAGLLVGVIGGIAGAIVGIVAGISSVISGIVSFISGIVNVIVGVFQLIWGWITRNDTMMSNATSKIVNGLSQIWSGLVTTVMGIITGLVSGVLGLLGGFLSGIGNWISNLGNIISGGAGTMLKAGGDLIAGLGDGITNAAQTVYDAIKGVATYLIDSIKQILGIASPSTVFAEIGNNLIQGLIDGVLSMLGKIGEAIGSVAGTILEKIGSLFGRGKEQQGDGISADSLVPNEQEVTARINAIQKAVEGFVKSVAAAWEGLGETINESWHSAWEGVGETVDGAADIISSFVDSASSAWEALTERMGSQWSDLWDDAGSILDGFFKAFENAMRGVENGIKGAADGGRRNLDRLEDAFDGLKSAVEDAKVTADTLKTATSNFTTSNVNTLKTAFRNLETAIYSATTEVGKLKDKVFALGGLKSTITVNLSSSGASLSGIAAKPSADGAQNLSASISPKASGGSVVAGNAYNVGELGEELFIPDQGGTIVPNHILRAALMGGFGGGGSGVHIETLEVNVNNPVVRDGVDIRRLADQVAAELSNKLNRRMAIGGSIF